MSLTTLLVPTMLSRAILVSILFLQLLTPAHAQESAAGRWEGAISIMGQQLLIAVKFTHDGDTLRATIDIPQQGAMELRLINVRQLENTVHFELPAGPGLAVFDGVIAADSIKGDFQQAGVVGTFYLARTEERPVQQPPQAPPPYREEEVAFANDTIRLAGTLTLPPTRGPHPAVILLTGSGPQNRDEELFGFRPFRIIADHLTRRGIAVLRYDDRGVGGSTGSTALSTTADFASDALAAVQFLMERPEIDYRKIGLCGHSEGGIVAAIAAAESHDVAFIILLAGTALPGDQILLAQLELIARADGMSEADIDKALSAQRRVFEAVRTDSGWQDVQKLLFEQARSQLATMTEEQRRSITDEDAFLNTRVSAQLKSAQGPWFRFFISLDPSEYLSRVTCPVLALFGELDLQVPAALNIDPLRRSLDRAGNKDVTIETFRKANHLFQAATTGSPKEYAGLKKEFAEGVLDVLSDWILDRVTVRR